LLCSAVALFLIFWTGVSASLPVSTLAACLPPPPGLTHWWPGDGTADDIVGGRPGTSVGGVTFDSGLVGQAFYLDGVNGFVNVPHEDSLNFGVADFTVGLWVKFDQVNSEQVLIEKYVETEAVVPREGWCLTKLPGASRLRFGGPIQVSLAEIIDVTLTSEILPGVWHHAAVTRKGKLFTLYWNGMPLAAGESEADLNTGASLKFGHRGNPDDTPGSVDSRNFFLAGCLDEVQFYNRALSAGEILAIFQAGGEGVCKKPATKGRTPFLELLLLD
jgi:hypothetical protein